MNEDPLTEKDLHGYLDITNWLLHINERYRFSLKYPQKFHIEEWGIYWPGCYDEKGITEKCKEKVESTGFQTAYYFFGEGQIDQVYYNLSFLLEIYQNKNKLSLEEWVKQTYPFKRRAICNRVSINNVNGLMCGNVNRDFFLSFPNTIFKNFFFIQGDMVYEFKIYEMGEDFLAQNSVYNTIISTFTILE